MDQTAPVIPPNPSVPVPVPPQAVVTQAPASPPPLLTQPTVTQAVGQAVSAAPQLPPLQPLQPVSYGVPDKERGESTQSPEKVPLVEVQEHEKIPEEVEGWMEKLEQAGEIKIPEPIKNDEQVLMDNATPATVQDTVVLPLTQSQAANAAKQKVSDSARWLYEWCQRLMKMLGARARYRE